VSSQEFLTLFCPNWKIVDCYTICLWIIFISTSFLFARRDLFVIIFLLRIHDSFLFAKRFIWQIAFLYMWFILHKSWSDDKKHAFKQNSRQKIFDAGSFRTKNAPIRQVVLTLQAYFPLPVRIAFSDFSVC